MQNLTDYVDRLVEEKGFDEKDPEVLTQIKTDLLNRIETRIDAIIAQSVPEDKLTEFEKVLEDGNSEDVFDFVKQHVPDIEERIAAELVSFKSTYLG
jgi:hypothetical protein